MDTAFLWVLQYLMKLFNVAVWSECTDAIITFTAQRTVKFIKNTTQQETLPDARQSQKSRRPAVCGSQRQKGVCWARAPESSMWAPVCPPTSSTPQVHQGGISTLGTHFTALQVDWNSLLRFLKHSLLLSQRGWDHCTDVAGVKHKTLPNLISFPLLYALGRGILLVVFSI